MKLIQSLSESHMLSSHTSFRRYSGRQIAELVYLHVIALRILACEPLSAQFGADYAAKSIRYLGFSKWYQNATDLHLLIYALMSEDVDLKMPEASQTFRETLYFDENELRYWMKDIAHHHISEPRTRKLFLHMDGQFQIKDGSMKAIRRLVQDWTHNSIRQKQLAMTRLLQMMRVRARQSDLLVMLEKLATEMKLELHNVNNPETGDEKREDGADPHHVAHKKPSFMGSLAATAVGAVLGYTAIKALTEGQIAYKGDDYVIIHNPTVQQINTLKDKANHSEGLRAILDQSGLYVWDGYFLNHDEAYQKLRLTDNSSFDLHLWANYVEVDVDGIWEETDDEKYGKAHALEVMDQIKAVIDGNAILRRYYDGEPPIQLDDGIDGEWLEDCRTRLSEDAAAGVTSAACIAPVVGVLGSMQRRTRKARKKRK